MKIIIIGYCGKLEIRGKCLEQYLVRGRHSVHFSAAIIIIIIITTAGL